MFQKKPSASEVDGVQYRRAKLWQIICYACNAFVGMSVYSLIGMASYSASIGYGITTATVGLILMLDRIRGQDDIPHIDLISKRTCNSSIYDPAHMIPVH